MSSSIDYNKYFNSTVCLTTTINIPTFMHGILLNVKKNRHKRFFFVVIADKKTPKTAKDYCIKLEKKFNYKIFYLDISFQNNFLKKFHKNFGDFFPK